MDNEQQLTTHVVVRTTSRLAALADAGLMVPQEPMRVKAKVSRAMRSIIRERLSRGVGGNVGDKQQATIQMYRDVFGLPMPPLTVTFSRSSVYGGRMYSLACRETLYCEGPTYRLQFNFLGRGVSGSTANDPSTVAGAIRAAAQESLPIAEMERAKNGLPERLLSDWRDAANGFPTRTSYAHDHYPLGPLNFELLDPAPAVVTAIMDIFSRHIQAIQGHAEAVERWEAVLSLPSFEYDARFV